MKINNSGNFIAKRITGFNKKTLEDLNRLLLQWSPKRYQMSPGYFKKLAKKSYVLALYDKKRVVGTVTLIEIHKLSGIKGSIEHLILDEKHRGRGLGKKLMNFAINLAKKLKIETLFLTCESKRTIANRLYKKLGFKIKKTNFYYLDLKK